MAHTPGCSVPLVGLGTGTSPQLVAGLIGRVRRAQAGGGSQGGRVPETTDMAATRHTRVPIAVKRVISSQLAARELRSGGTARWLAISPGRRRVAAFRAARSPARLSARAAAPAQRRAAGSLPPGPRSWRRDARVRRCFLRQAPDELAFAPAVAVVFPFPGQPPLADLPPEQVDPIRRGDIRHSRWPPRCAHRDLPGQKPVTRTSARPASQPRSGHSPASARRRNPRPDPTTRSVRDGQRDNTPHTPQQPMNRG